MRPLRVAVIGFGKIARDQHVPSIAGHERLELAATVSPNSPGIEGLPSFRTPAELLAAGLELDAVAITTPPSVRYDIAADCIAAGLHCLLEKPPTVTLGEIEALACLAQGRQVTLFTTWHARHNPAVRAAAQALAGQRIASMDVRWHEDVRKWHPGQQWIWEPGGFGVFDPGINAFSILTSIFPGGLFVKESELFFPANRQAPIAAEIAFKSPVASGPLTCSLDWRYTEGESWTMAIRTEDGRELLIAEGGARLAIDGAEVPGEGLPEYPDIYRAFVELIDERRSHVDVRPLRLVGDAFLLGRRTEVEAFVD